MKRIGDTFDGQKELGARLRELRIEAGLNQSELAGLMGRRGGSAHTLISRLENGHIQHPSLNLILDFLRACQSCVSDITEVLDRYVRQPTVVDREGRAAVRGQLQHLPDKVASRVSRYDAKTAAARRFSGKKPEPVDERVERVRRQAASWLLRQELSDRLRDLMNRLGVQQAMTVLYGTYGRKVWSILKKTRKRDRRNREPLLAQARERVLELELMPKEHAAEVEQTVRALFDVLEAEGRLDYIPEQAEAEEVMRRKQRAGPTKAESRLGAERGTELLQQDRARWQAVRELSSALTAHLAGVGIRDDKSRQPFLYLSRKLYILGRSIVQHGEDRAQAVDAFVVSQQELDPELVRGIAAFAVDWFEENIGMFGTGTRSDA